MSVQTVRDIDVLVVGAGPAGATTALNLAATRSVLLVDRLVDPRPRAGESLPAASRHLLADMGLWDAFVASGHTPRFAAQSTWGSPDLDIADDIRNPDGHGWLLDRRQFDRILRDEACRRGARLEAPAAVVRVNATQDAVTATIINLATASERTVRTGIVVDATGRRASIARLGGTRRHGVDRLMARYLIGRQERVHKGVTHVEAAPDGWWYTAALSGQRRILAFHTDADLLRRAGPRSVSDFRECTSGSLHLRDALDGFDATDATIHTVTAASSRLDPLTSDRILAVGDAAIAFDPLSAQGLHNALFTGLAAATTSSRVLDGNCRAVNDYAAMLDMIWRRYVRVLDAYYRMEQRWPRRCFWTRRHGGLRRQGGLDVRGAPGEH